MGLVTESARIRRLLVEGGGRPEEPDPHARCRPPYRARRMSAMSINAV
jgi:hypothetical protein